MAPPLLRGLAWLAVTSVLAACGEPDPEEPARTTPGFDAEAVEELRELGLDRYFGRFEPSEVIEHGDGETGYRFAEDEQGPICLFGAPYQFAIRDRGSEDLLIYLQGGGACWSELCAAQTRATDRVPGVGWTDTSREENAFTDYNLAYISYCDGSVFTGDTRVEGPDGVRYHRGLANLSAALDVVKERYPEPRRVVLAGSSAGGYGTILGTAVVRLMWPTTPLGVFNDAGLGLTNPERPETLELMKEEWAFDELVPASCSKCQEGQFTEMIGWSLQRDPTLRVGAFSSYEDFVIGSTFLSMEPAAFKQLIVSETDKQHGAFPSRFKRYFISGSQHTAAFGYFDHELNGVLFTDWIRAMLDGDPAWVDLLAPEPSEPE